MRRGPGRACADRSRESGAAGDGPATRRMSGLPTAAEAESGEAEAYEGEGRWFGDGFRYLTEYLLG